MKDATKHLNGYSPGDAFKEVDPLPPLVEDAASSHTELWLVQLPVNEVSPSPSSFCFAVGFRDGTGWDRGFSWQLSLVSGIAVRPQGFDGQAVDHATA